MTGVCTIVAEAMITGRFASTDDQIRDEPRKSVNRLDVRKVGLDGNVLLMWRGFTRGYLRRQVPSFLLMDEPDCVTGPSMRVPRVGPSCHTALMMSWQASLRRCPTLGMVEVQVDSGVFLRPSRCLGIIGARSSSATKADQNLVASVKNK